MIDQSAQSAAAADGTGPSRRPAMSQLDRACNLTIMAIVALPFVLAAGALVRRLLGDTDAHFGLAAHIST